jgi:hypothetical protein
MIWSDNIEIYNGKQLRSLWAYMNFGLLGDSIVAWRGPCNVPLTHMVDGEDARERSEIRGSDMVHFIVEIFGRDLYAAVALQRLLTTHAQMILLRRCPGLQLVRTGDDLYDMERKLSISVATASPVSSLIHFAVNVSNEGTPVPTFSLEELKVNPEEFATELMAQFSEECTSIQQATCKVFGVQ